MKKFFKKIMSKIAQITSKIHMPYTRKKVTQEIVYRALKVLKPGDLILTHVDGELTSIVLSYYSHAAIYDIGTVWEATTHGVVESNIIFFLAHKDDFAIYRPNFKFDAHKIPEFLKTTLGVAYDFEFNSDNKTFYCFELAAVAYMQTSKAIISPIKTIAGNQYLSRSFMTDNFTRVFF